MDASHSSRRWFHGCLVVFALSVGLSAIHPLYPSDWWLENALAVALVALLFFTRNLFPFSRTSYTLIFVFLLFHELGAHYTYAEVPYREWIPFLNVTERNQSVRVRANFQAKTMDNKGGVRDVHQIEEEKYYTEFFAKVDKGVFLEKEKL